MPKLTRSRDGNPGGSNRPSLPGHNIKVPKFFADLYADLRDRRLLPLVALLLVAIIAAPLILNDKSEEEPAAPPITATPQASSSDASFSVVPSEPGLRDYRRRLGGREARDPFVQPGSSSGSGEPTTASEGTEAQPGGEAPSPTESPATEVETSPVPIETTPAPVELESNPPVKHTETTHKVVVERELNGFAININAGFLGHVSDQTEVPPMTKLPNAKHPVVVYIGPNDDNTGAVFLMTNNVSAFYGKGHCKLGGQICQLLELKTGQSATFAYGYGEARYKVQLSKLVPVIDSHRIEAKATTTEHGSSSGSSGE